ncbi:MAG TPA: hypothetical protein VGG39_20765 [Polyangiaceae bacterium]|jgi:hypothetical protein
MLSLRAIALSGLTALALVACGGVGSDGTEDTGSSQAAVTSGKGGVGTTCQTDSSCRSSLVCEPICPVIPGRPHCEIAGGTCEASCTRSGASLEGETFTSADGAHSITFSSPNEFSKTDGCSGTIHCEHIELTTGTYSSNGTSVRLTSTTGAHDTLSVESHCYQGLLDESDGVDLYPAAGE